MDKINKIENLLIQIGAINKSYEKIAKITGENFNVFEVLGMTTNEVRTHSAFIAELLDPSGSHGRGNVFLKEFVERLREINNKQRNTQILFDIDKVKKVSVEYWLGPKTETEGGYIDILLTDNKNQHIIIENKIYAVDQDKQLFRYHNFAKSAPLVYLTLNGNPPSESSTLKDENVNNCLIRISYKEDIIEWLEGCKKYSVDYPILRETISQYMNLIKKLTNQTMANEEKEEVISVIMNNSNYMTSIQELSDNNIWIDIKNKILVKLKSLILGENGLGKELGLEEIIWDDKDNIMPLDFLFYRKNSWKKCIYFRFGNDFNTISYGIDVINDEENKRDYNTKVEFKKRLIGLGESINDEDWIWKSNFNEYDDMSWFELQTKGRDLFKNKVNEIIKLVDDIM
jgi:hypothetical protein